MKELVEKRPDLCEAWVAPAGGIPPPGSLPLPAEWLELSPDLFRALDTFGTDFPILCAGLPAIPRWTPAEGFREGCSVLVPFQDPENVGAVIRSAAALGAAQVILMKESAHPFHPKSIRASGGSVFTIPLREGCSISDLTGDLPLVVLSAKGRDLRTVHFPDAFGLLAGMEGPGLPEPLRDETVGIPLTGGVESLNAAVAASLALYEWNRRTR